MAQGRKGQVRLADVAARAGVSSKTVSNVVHDYPHVSPELRARVQAAIEELGYRPNLTARRLVTGRTGMIALAIPWVDQPYFAELARWVGEEAARRGYRVLIEQTANSIELERAVLRDREEGMVDGVIFHPVMIDTLEIARLQPDTPLVLLGESASPLTTDHVMVDNIEAARSGVDLLLARGCRRIAFLATIRDDITGSTQLRLQGYQEALLAAGVRPDPALVLRSEGWAIEDAAAALARVLAEGVELDAVFCRDDTFAMGALQALSGAGRRVPEEVAVLGWDDTTLARCSTPGLTSVAPDKAEIAAVALGLLQERMSGYRGIGRHRLVGYRIAERGTTPVPIYSAE
jgi:DNA-binding LacI/PurR family transcriptional regulator